MLAQKILIFRAQRGDGGAQGGAKSRAVLGGRVASSSGDAPELAMRSSSSSSLALSSRARFRRNAIRVAATRTHAPSGPRPE